MPLLEVTRSQTTSTNVASQAAPLGGRFLDSASCLAGALGAIRGEGNGNMMPELIARLVDFVVDIAQPKVRVVSLKQIRDVAEPGRACLRQVVELGTTVTDFSEGGFYGGTFDLAFHPVFTDRLAHDLGIILEEGGIQREVGGFWARATFTMGEGTVIR